MQKVEIHLANEGSRFAVFSTDLRLIFGFNVGNEFGVMLREKEIHKLDLCHCPHILFHYIQGLD